MLKDDKGHIIKKDTVVTDSIFSDIYGKYPEKYCNVRLDNGIRTWMCVCDGYYTAWDLANVSRKEFLKVRNLGAKSYPDFVRFQTWLKNELEDAENVSSCQGDYSFFDIKKINKELANMRMKPQFRILLGILMQNLVKEYLSKGSGNIESSLKKVDDYFHDVDVMESIVAQISGECQKEQQ